MIIENVGNFSVTKTFDCGQCFRFDPVPGEEECFEGVAFGNYARFRRTDGGLEITDGTDQAVLDSLSSGLTRTTAR